MSSFPVSSTSFDRSAYDALGSGSSVGRKCFRVTESPCSLMEKVGTCAAIITAGTFVSGVLPEEGLYPGALCTSLVIRNIGLVAIGYMKYPRAVSSFFSFNNREFFDREILLLESRLKEIFEYTEVNEVVLQKGATSYSAIECLYFEEDGTPSDKWIIKGFGNGVAVEDGCGGHGEDRCFTFEAAKKALEEGTNILFVSGPGVGKSGGVPTAANFKEVGDVAGEYVISRYDPRRMRFEGLSHKEEMEAPCGRWT